MQKERDVIMKKLLIVILMATAFFCGCQVNNESTNVSEYSEELSKTQEIAVIPANTSDVEKTLTESKDIESFITALDMEHWELKTLPQTAESVGTFYFSQEETIKFGESATDGELHYVFEMVCYKEIPYVTLKMTRLKMTFKVPDETAKYLTEYFI